jgi:hypothetical protein
LKLTSSALAEVTAPLAVHASVAIRIGKTVLMIRAENIGRDIASDVAFTASR